MSKFLIPALLTIGGGTIAGGSYVYARRHSFPWSKNLSLEEKLSQTKKRLEEAMREIEAEAEKVNKKDEFKKLVEKIFVNESVKKVLESKIEGDENNRKNLSDKQKSAQTEIKNLKETLKKDDETLKSVFQKIEEFKKLLKKSWDELIQAGKENNSSIFSLNFSDENEISVNLKNS